MTGFMSAQAMYLPETCKERKIVKKWKDFPTKARIIFTNINTKLFLHLKIK